MQIKTEGSRMLNAPPNVSRLIYGQQQYDCLVTTSIRQTTCCGNISLPLNQQMQLKVILTLLIYRLFFPLIDQPCPEISLVTHTNY